MFFPLETVNKKKRQLTAVCVDRRGPQPHLWQRAARKRTQLKERKNGANGDRRRTGENSGKPADPYFVMKCKACRRRKGATENSSNARVSRKGGRCPDV